MKIRALTNHDMKQLERIHELYFRDQFNFPDLMSYICAFVVEDNNGEIITGGGIRDIAECALITDLSRDPRERIKALYEMLDVSKFVCRKSGYDQIYVWSQVPKWTNRLRRNGFRSPEGESLILDL